MLPRKGSQVRPGVEFGNGECCMGTSGQSRRAASRVFHSLQKNVLGSPVEQSLLGWKERKSVVSVKCSVLADVSQEIVVAMPEKPSADPKTTLAIILGGGAGTRLFPLT